MRFRLKDFFLNLCYRMSGISKAAFEKVIVKSTEKVSVSDLSVESVKRKLGPSGNYYYSQLPIIKEESKLSLIFLTDKIFFKGGISLSNDFKGDCFYLRKDESTENLFKNIQRLEKHIGKTNILLEDGNSKLRETSFKSCISENDEYGLSIRVYYKRQFQSGAVTTLLTGKGVESQPKTLEELKVHFRNRVTAKLVLSISSLKCSRSRELSLVIRCEQIKIVEEAKPREAIDYFVDFEDEE